jgi:hypothetical protein
VSRGDHEWTARFEGSNAWRPSISAPATHHTGIQTFTSVTATANPVPEGGTGELHGTVDAYGGGPLPAGTVSLRNAADQVLATQAVGGSNKAFEFGLPGLSLGQLDLTASYASISDGSPSQMPYRLFVITPGIAETWAGIVPMSSGDLWLKRVSADDDGVYVAGETVGTASGETSAGLLDIVVARFDPSGALAWVTQFGTAGDEHVTGLTLTEAGVFVSGDTNGALEPRPIDGLLHGFLARLSRSGEIEWLRQEVVRGEPWQVVPGPDDGVYVAGTLDQVGSSGLSILVRRYAADGTTTWERTIDACCRPANHPGLAGLTDLASDPGGVLVVGTVEGSTISNTIRDDAWALVRRYGHDGTVLWTREFGGNGGSVTPNHVAASERGILVMGTSLLPITGEPNAFPRYNPWTRRYGFDGSTIWTKAFTADALVARCGAFVTGKRIAGVPVDAIGSEVTGINLDGVTQWRYQALPTLPSSADHHDVAVLGGRAYVVEEGLRADGAASHLVAVDGLPLPLDCDTVAPTVTAPRARFVVGARFGPTAEVAIPWTATDAASGVARNELRESVAGGPWLIVSD